MNNYLNYDAIIKLYQSEKVLFPSMIHEKLYKRISLNPKHIFESINVLKTIAESLSQADNIETSIYIDQYLHLQTIHGCFFCLVLKLHIG